ncbi:two-component system KDP operon response regulator KdpE [Crenobacter luteus]|uniref:two-component system response regulator KdpE n=1 Tax=Crenobacter luteus TaxID=1452487 RepID=UPI00104D2041|nr:two-component system response regulator KdpE [Crenobacter luteus]TCP12600.1 two-component system KDP operon response regulator KdpE [Crenobacter luteus]
MSAAAPILVVEDEPQIRRFLRASLTAEGFAVREAGSAREGLAEAARHLPQLVLLDLGLPDADGETVIRALREWSAVPVIVLSARSQEADKVAALDAGADDYLTKPFGVAELLARIRVALRHRLSSAQPSSPVIAVGELTIDLAAHTVARAGEAVHLTPLEFRLLAELARHAGKVLTHRHLLKEVWGPSAVEQNHYLRIYMAQLRHKLEADPAKPRHLLTETGVGYRFAADA